MMTYSIYVIREVQESFLGNYFAVVVNSIGSEGHIILASINKA